LQTARATKLWQLKEKKFFAGLKIPSALTLSTTLNAVVGGKEQEEEGRNRALTALN
jgi:hypothetical protein